VEVCLLGIFFPVGYIQRTSKEGEAVNDHLASARWSPKMEDVDERDQVSGMGYNE